MESNSGVPAATGGPTRRFRVKLALGGLLILIAFFLAVKWLTVAEIETSPQPLGPKNWPVTVEETVRDILPRLSRLEKLRIMFMKKEDTASLHFELGLWIRNRYGLWRGNEKLILSACGFRCHPDEASGKIVDAVWQALHE
jgi:hypothetical protein